MLIVAPQKFDVLKTNICPRSEVLGANVLVLRTSNFKQTIIRPIAQRHKHSSLYCSPQWQIQTLNMSKTSQPCQLFFLFTCFLFLPKIVAKGLLWICHCCISSAPKYRTHKVTFAVQLHKTKLYNGQLQA